MRTACLMRRRQVMRNAMLATLALLAAAAATVAGSGPAAAVGYPYWLPGWRLGRSGRLLLPVLRRMPGERVRATRLLQRQSPLRLRPTAAGAAVSGLLKSGDSRHAPAFAGHDEFAAALDAGLVAAIL